MSTYISKNSKKAPFLGVATALATPFSDGEVDFAAFRRLCRRQNGSGVDAVCVSGTTGEAATLTYDERRALCRAAREECDVPLLVGCGSADTATAQKYVRAAVEDGADALLVITPYCNKGTEKGIYEHFLRVCSAAQGLPVILYNVPSRTGVDLSLSQCEELAKIENVVAIKEAATSLAKITALIASPLTVYSGNDDMTLPVLSLGGGGVISVVSNLFPAELAKMTHLAADGDFASAREYAHRFARLTRLLFAQTNPAPLKFAMGEMGLCKGELRLPMGEISEPLKEQIRAELASL